MLLLSILFAAALQRNVASVIRIYERDYASRLVPLLSEVLHFSTTQGDEEAHAAQKAWLAKTAKDLGFTYRDAGLVDEKNPIVDLQKGTRVVIHALVDIATGKKIDGAFKP